MRAAVLGFVATSVIACGSPSRGSDGDGALPPWSEPGGDGDDGGDELDDDDGETSSTADGSTDAMTDDGGTDDPAPGYPHIARIGMPAAWSVEPDGTWTYPYGPMSPFHALGQAFYAEHGDDYDFLAVYTEGELMDFFALADTVRYDIQGIGLDGLQGVAQPSDAGSAGRLQQINVMNAPQLYAFDPSAADVLVHEIAHRWSAFIELEGTPEPAYLLDAAWSHWNIHVHGGGPSATGYGDVTDLGDGSFRYASIRPLRFSPLELYLAGFIPPEEVPPLFYVANASNYDPATSVTGEPMSRSSYGEDATFIGTRIDFGIDAVIAANGPRVPAFGEAQSHFRVAFVLACADASTCSDADLAIVEAQRTALPAQFSAATGGRATLETDL
jgi:hypothetical protein